MHLNWKKLNYFTRAIYSEVLEWAKTLRETNAELGYQKLTNTEARCYRLAASSAKVKCKRSKKLIRSGLEFEQGNLR